MSRQDAPDADSRPGGERGCGPRQKAVEDGGPPSSTGRAQASRASGSATGGDAPEPALACVLPGFAARGLPVDPELVLRCAGRHVPHPRPERDALMAATARVPRMGPVTRTPGDAAETGVPRIDPRRTGEDAG